MGDTLIETPLGSHAAPHKKTGPSPLPSLGNFEGAAVEGGDEYGSLKKLQGQLEYIQLQEEYIKDEQR